MQYTAYIYKALFDESPIDQIETIRWITIEEQLDSFSTLSFDVDYYMSNSWILNTTNLKEFRRVRIVEETEIQKTIFEWVIFELFPNFTSIKVNCRDYRWFLESKRFLQTRKTYTAQTSDFILNDLINSLNAKTSWDLFPENWTFTTDEVKTGIDWIFAIWTSYFTIFKEIALKMWKSWYIKENGVIEFKNIVWEDKSDGENFLELVYNLEDPTENTIWDIPSATMQWTMANSIINQTGTNTDNSRAIDEYIRLEDYQSLNTTEITNYLEKSSKIQLIYTFDIKFSRLDGQINIWDKLAVRIETGLIHLDIEWALIVTRKKSTISWNEIQTLDIDVSEIDIARDTFLKKFKDVRQEIKNLKIG